MYQIQRKYNNNTNLKEKERPTDRAVMVAQKGVCVQMDDDEGGERNIRKEKSKRTDETWRDRGGGGGASGLLRRSFTIYTKIKIQNIYYF